ncbi:MAG: hypothetical protein ABSD56_03900 [Bryobacteraceae bacterium]
MDLLNELPVRFDLQTVSQFSSIVLTFFTAWLTLIILKFTVRPKIRISAHGRRRWSPSEPATLRFDLKNVGHWYGRPPATNTKVYVNVAPPLEPIKIRYGSILERTDEKVGPGKGGVKCLRAEGIDLFYEEPGESIELQLMTPDAKGRYRIWLSLYSEQGGHTVYRTSLRVLPRPVPKAGADQEW